MKNEKSRVLVIVPAYNEEANIEKMLNELQSVGNQMVDECELDYVVINDCSTDNTLSILQHKNAHYLNLPINLGIGGGMQTGYKYALRNGYDIAIQMDGDGQHIPQYISELIAPIIAGEADMVVGSRFIKHEGFQSSALRRVGIGFLSGLIYICCKVKVKDVTSGFRAVNKCIIELFSKEYAQDYPEPESIIACALNNMKIKEIPVTMRERLGGKSSISSFKSVYYMVKVSIAILLQRLFVRREKR